MILLFFVLTAMVLYYYWERRKLIWLARKINGPSGYPLIGSAYKFLNANKILDVIHDFSRTYGGPGKFWLGNRLFVYINDPAHFEIILNSPTCLDKGDSYDFITESIGYGLITLKSDRWRFHRKYLNPSFSYNVVNSFYPIFNKNLKILTKKLKQRSIAGPFDIQDDLKSCAMDMICETTLGLDIHTQTQENLDFLHAAYEIFAITAQRIFQPWIQPNVLFRLSTYYKRFRESVCKLNALLEELFSTKKIEYFQTILEKSKEKDAENNNNNIDSNTVEKNIFIDRIMRLALEENLFADSDVLDELKTILLAGFETTATAATITCALLALFPEFQEKIFEEIQSVLPDQDVDVTQEDLRNMPYLDAFIKETLRFFPVVPFLTRIVKEEMRLDDVTIPKGTEFIMDIWNMHRIPHNWKFDATKFNPENCFPENAVTRHAYSYVPFSAGPRNCIGIKYGNLALKLIVVYIVRQYRLSTKLKLEDLKFRMNITLGLTNKNMLELQCRNEY